MAIYGNLTGYSCGYSLSIGTSIDPIELMMSYDQIQEETLKCHGTINTFIHDHWQLRKIASRWVPHMLNYEAKQKRVNICQENLEKLKSNGET
jgi:hypothetical protein